MNNQYLNDKKLKHSENLQSKSGMECLIDYVRFIHGNLFHPLTFFGYSSMCNLLYLACSPENIYGHISSKKRYLAVCRMIHCNVDPDEEIPS